MVDDNGAMGKEKAGHGKEDGEFQDLGRTDTLESSGWVSWWR